MVSWYRGIAVLVFLSPSLYLITAPKCKNNDVDNSDEPKRSHKVRPLSEKVNFST